LVGDHKIQAFAPRRQKQDHSILQVDRRHLLLHRRRRLYHRTLLHRRRLDHRTLLPHLVHRILPLLSGTPEASH
jgi:hypothetical protein